MSTTRTGIVTCDRPHSIHLAVANEQWGQPPASQYAFRIHGDVMHGSIVATVTSSSPWSHQVDSALYCEHADAEMTWKGQERSRWSTSDEELAALYSEVEEEDRFLARLGSQHYAQLLRQEDRDM
jgi:hypothetical protein